MFILLLLAPFLHPLLQAAALHTQAAQLKSEISQVGARRETMAATLGDASKEIETLEQVLPWRLFELCENFAFYDAWLMVTILCLYFAPFQFLFNLYIPSLRFSLS